jgi:hypothetical protein
MNEPSQNKLATEKPAETALKKRMTDGELREAAIKLFDSTLTPFKRMSEIDPKSEKRKDKENRKKYALEAVLSMGLETHEQLAMSMDEGYRPLAREMSRQMIKDYDCKAAAEKALVEVAVSAYVRVLDSSWLMSSIHQNLKDVAKEKNHLYAIWSKELDRANRQFINAIITLKQLKAPTIEMNVRANTAFIAQNQQINADNPPKPTNSETNEH